MVPPDIRTSSWPVTGSGPLLASSAAMPPPIPIVAPGKVALESMRGDRDRAAARGRRARHVGAGALVAAGGDDHHARARGVVGGDRIGRVGGAEVGAERHADDVRAVLDGLVDGLGHDVSRAGAAEDAVDVERASGATPGPILKSVRSVARRVVRPGVGRAVLEDAHARRACWRCGCRGCCSRAGWRPDAECRSGEPAAALAS